MTNINDSESTSEPRKKDEFWWIHPNLRGKGALHPGDLPGIPYDSHVWVEYSGESEQEEYTSERGIPFGEGNYTELAKVLFKLNAYRPGPVKGWYIVVTTESLHINYTIAMGKYNKNDGSNLKYSLGTKIKCIKFCRHT